MTYEFKSKIVLPAAESGLIATALNGVVYVENSRLHVKGNKMHFIYKPDGSPAGWYARNLKTLDEIFLGAGAAPTLELENVNAEAAAAWEEITQKEKEGATQPSADAGQA